MDINEWVKMVHGPNVSPGDLTRIHKVPAPSPTPLSRAQSWVEASRNSLREGDLPAALRCLENVSEALTDLEDES